MRRLLLAFGISFGLSIRSSRRTTGPPSRSRSWSRLPGSATDVMARIVFDEVSQQVGQPIVIENRPGAAIRSA